MDKLVQRLIILLTVFSTFASQAQELNCQVTVISDNKLELTSVELEILDQLKNTIYELMNNTKWTKDEFEVEERINCQLQLQIQQIPTPGTYRGMIQIQSSRPAFNSSYNTMLLNFQDDDVTFNYARNAVLVYAPNQYRDNLTSLLAFYAYYIIGLDYDSFGDKGGEQYLREAQNVVALASNSAFPGWRSNEQNKNNRYWLADNALHQLFEPLRTCMYEYHRKGIDMLYTDLPGARMAIYNALNLLTKVSAARPNSLNVRLFIQAKTDELKGLYANAEQREKTDIVNLLKRLDPVNSEKYQAIMQ